MRRILLFSLFLACGSTNAAEPVAGNELESTTTAEASGEPEADAETGGDPVRGEVRRTERAIEEVVVVGDYVERTLQDAAHSLTVFNVEDLRRGTERNLTEIYQRVPNVTTDNEGQVRFRGIARDGIQSSGLPTDINFSDGIFSLVPPHLWDVEQVEILRGNQNAISGGAIGGVTATGTAKPGDVLSGRLRVDYSGGPDDLAAGVAVGGPLTDEWSYRLSAYGRRDDGHLRNVTRDDSAWANTDEVNGRIQLYWRPQSQIDTEIRFRIEYIDRNRGALDEQPLFLPTGPVDPFDREVATDADTRRDDEIGGYTMDVHHRFNDRWSMNFQMGGGIRRERETFDDDLTPLPLAVHVVKADTHSFGQQLFLYYEGERWRLSLREYVLHLDFDLINESRFVFDLDDAGPLPPADVSVDYRYPTSHWYFYGQQVSAARDFGRLGVEASILYSGQWSNVTQRLQSFRDSSTGDPAVDAIYDDVLTNFFPQLVFTETIDRGNWLPQMTLTWEFDNGFTAGFKYERGHRQGLVFFNQARREAVPYDDEFGDGFDLFLRGSLFDQRLSLRANVFYTKLTDQQVFAALSADPNDSQIVNAQRAHNGGFELEANWAAASWNLWVGVGLLEAEMDRIKVGDVDFSGNDFPFAPSWSLSMGFIWDRGDGPFASVDLSAQDDAESFFDNRPGSGSDGRTLVNARLGWRTRNFEVSLFARNLLDEEYLIDRDRGLVDPRFQYYVTGEPREVGVTVEYDW